MLIFPLKKEWYDKIKSGEKTVEYREVKPYWMKRLNQDCMFPWNCKLCLGYTSQYMIAKIIKIEIVNGKDTDLHIAKPVYAIHLADVKEKRK